MKHTSRLIQNIINPLLLSLCLIIFSTAEVFSAEALFLKNGKVLFGTVISETNQSYKFREKRKSKTIKVSRKNILRVLYNIDEIKVKYIYKKDGALLKAYIVSEDRKEIIIRKILNRPKEETIIRKDILSISEKKIDTQKTYTFIVKSNGKNLSIEGGFTGWKTIPMEKDGNKWTKDIQIDILKRNNYEYRIVKDGKPGQSKYISFKMEEGKLVEKIELLKFTVGLRAGIGMYNTGFSENLKINQPILSIIFKTNFIFLWDQLAFQAELNYFKHSPKKNANPLITDFTIETDNFIFGEFAVLDFYFFKDFGIHPKLGGGYVFQNTEATGETTYNLKNSFPFVGAGVELSYNLNRFLNIAINLQSFIEIESGTITMLNGLTLGVDYKI